MVVRTGIALQPLVKTLVVLNLIAMEADLAFDFSASHGDALG